MGGPTLARVRIAATYAAVVIWAIAWSFPWRIIRPGDRPMDTSFTPLSHTFFAEGRPWGTHSLHTSGLWGFLRFPHYDGRTFSLYVLVHVAIAGVIGWFFADRYSKLPQRKWLYALFAALLLPLVAASDDARWYVPLFGLLIVRTRDGSRGVLSPLTCALALGAALAFHTKGNFFFGTAVVAAALLVVDLTRRRFPWTPVLMLGYAIGLLYAGGGTMAGFLRHAVHVVESTRAYAESFSQSRDLWTPAVFLLGTVCAATSRLLLTERRSQWPLALAYGALLFFLYKAAFVRQDAPHIVRSVTALFLVVGSEAVAAICGWSSQPLSRWRKWTAAGLSVVSLCLFLPSLSHGRAWKSLRNQIRKYPAAAATFLEQSTQTRENDLALQLKRITRRSPLKGVDGSISVVGTFHTLLLAHGHHLETPPVIAHYEAWSPRTVEAIDRWLAGDDAPRFLVRSAAYPSASNEITVARFYKSVYKSKRYTLLKRRDEPRPVKTRLLYEGSVGWNEEIDIPTKHRKTLLVAQVHFRQNAAGRLVSFLHHAPRVEMKLHKFNGKTPVVRLNSLVAESGVVVAAHSGRWGAEHRSLHHARHPILNKVQSRVYRITFRSQHVGSDSSALFEPKLDIKIWAVSLQGKD